MDVLKHLNAWVKELTEVEFTGEDLAATDT
jgi:hypothetical protein